MWTFINLIYMIPLESKLTPQRGHKLEHRNKEDQLQNSSLKLEGIELRFLAPLAVGQRAYVMVCCPLCVCPSGRPSTFSLNIFFSETTYRILMKFYRCSCRSPLQNFLKEFDSFKNSGCYSNKTKKKMKTLKIFLSEAIRPRATKFGM